MLVLFISQRYNLDLYVVLSMRITAVILSFCFLTGCTLHQSKDIVWFQQKERIKILTTIAMINDIVEQVGGRYVSSIPLIRGELDPHSYELVKGDDEKFLSADIIFYNGLGLEHGWSLRQNLLDNPKAISIGDYILYKNPNSILIVDGKYDPHIWMDISLWEQSVDLIKDILCKKDPKHASEYISNAEMLHDKMRDADKSAYDRLQSIDLSKRYLVTSHASFNYFTKHYLSQESEDWRSRCISVEGLAPESQINLKDLIEITYKVQKLKIDVLFAESNVNHDSLKKIVYAARKNGSSVHICDKDLYGDAMSEASSYLDMINHNVSVIYEELSR